MAKKKPQISLSSAEEVRDKITARQTKQIQAMFTRLAKEAREKAKKLEGRDNISSIIQKKYLEDLAKELEHQLNADFANLKKNLEQDMTQVSESVIDCIREFEESVGMPISNSWLNVPVDAVEAVQSGKLYAGNWTLSSRIWGMERKVIKDIHTVIAEGIAANKSAYDIAKDLEKYVDPKARKDWNWSKVYPGTNRKVDYSAQRLARTMVSHAYQFSFVESTKDNPFIEKYKWISSHDKRVCPICKERDGKLFDKDKLPLDHPNGRCTFVSVFEKSATQISDEMAAWVKGKEGDFPKIDEYMKKKFGTDRYEKAMQMAMQGMKQEEKMDRAELSESGKILYSLKKPKRPKKRDFENEDDFYAARDLYYKEKERYESELEKWVSKNMFEPMSKDEADAWAKSNGVKIGNVDGLDTRVIRAYSERFERLSKDFQIVMKYHKDVDIPFTVDFGKDDIFEAAANWGMRFGGSYKNYTEAIKNFADTRVGGEWFVRGDGTINSLFDHEFGHQVEMAIRGAGTDRWDKTRGMEKDLIDTVYGKDGMSEYASSHPEELFAEGFAAWYGGEDTEFAKAFGKFLERWIKL